MYSQLHGWKALIFICVAHVCTAVLILGDKLPGDAYVYLLIGSGMYAAGNTVLKKHNADAAAQQIQQAQQTGSSPYPPDFESGWH